MLKSCVNSFNWLSQSRIGKSFGLLSIAQALNAVTNFGIMTFYTKRLPPAEYGKISLVWLFVVIMSIFVDCRLNTAFSIKFYKSDHVERTSVIYTIIFCNLLLWGVLYVAFLIIPNVIGFLFKVEIPKEDLHIIFVLVALMVLGNFYSSYLIVSRQPEHYLKIMIIFNGLLLLGTILFLVVADHGYRSYFEAYLVAYLVMAGAGVYHITKEYPLVLGAGFSRTLLTKLLKISIPLIPDGLMLMILIWAGRYIINFYDGLAVVGVYSVAFSFSNIFNNFIVTPFGQAIFPVAAERFVRSEQDYGRLMQRIFKYYWIGILTLILVYFVVLQDVYRLFVGIKYHASYNVVFIMLLGTVFSGAAGLLGATIIMKEKTGKMFQFTVISSLVNVSLSLALIPYLDMYGAAVAVMAGYAVQFGIVLWYTQRLLKVAYDYRFVFHSILLTLVFIVMIWALSYVVIPPLLQTGLKVCLAGIYLLFVFKKYDLKRNYQALVKEIQGRAEQSPLKEVGAL